MPNILPETEVRGIFFHLVYVTFLAAGTRLS